MNKASQQYLLRLARQTLEYYFASGNVLYIAENQLDTDLIEQRGTFVTLTKHGQLRGCIGHIEPVQEIYKDVIDNALAAAFQDSRFLPLRREELPDVEIEISVLTLPEELKYTSVADLLVKIIPLKHGVIIQKGRQSATYLPQVWENLSDKEDFLTSLCLKAGLQSDEWQTGNLEIQTYQAEVFAEKS